MREIVRMVNRQFDKSELNRLPDQYGGVRIFSKPLVGVAGGGDPIFDKFKEVVHPEHLTPEEMWLESGMSGGSGLADRLRVIAVVFPYVEEIRKESRRKRRMPADIYSLGRNFANAFIGDVLRRTVRHLEERGYTALAGVQSPRFQILAKEPQKIASTWSERHMAFAAGLGTFSLHEGLITEAGCNIRLGSVLTDAPLEVTQRPSDDPYGNCLHFAGEKCMKCAKRCPGDAISESGHDKVKCYLYGRVVEREMNRKLKAHLKPHRRVIDGREQISHPVGCAFCQFGVPCMDKNPMSGRKKNNEIEIV